MVAAAGRQGDAQVNDAAKSRVTKLIDKRAECSIDVLR
jgi:hypothetical protein